MTAGDGALPEGGSTPVDPGAATGEVPPPPLPVDAPWRDLAIDARQVSKRFGAVDAVIDVSLALPAGRILGVVGPSGSGKTTTIRMITGAIRPTSGALRVLGRKPSSFPRTTRERIGYMPQQNVLYPELSGRENVDFAAASFGMFGGKRRRAVESVLRLVQLWDERDRLVSNMSGGMQRRVTLATALVHDPELLILDEPTAGIDPLLRQEVWDELRRLRDNGVTIVVTTQYVTEAEYCDLVALIATGEVIAFASPMDVRRQALGGEVIQIATTRAFDARQLPPLASVLEIRQIGPRELHVIAPNAGEAQPDVADAIRDAGGEVEWSREYRPTFDDVFAELVTRHAELSADGQTVAPAGGESGGLRPPGTVH
jgi:ABC-2 type transport system ATP-binding protein